MKDLVVIALLLLGAGLFLVDTFGWLESLDKNLQSGGLFCWITATILKLYWEKP